MTTQTQLAPHVQSVRVSGDLRMWVLEAQLWIIGLAPMLSALASPRYFSDDYAAALTGTGAPSDLQRVVSLMSGRGLLLVAALGAVAMIPTARFSPVGRPLALAFLALAGASLLSAGLGTVRGSPVQSVTLVLAGLCWYLAPTLDPAWLLRRLRPLFRVYAIGSLALIAVVPGWALEYDYADSVLPGISIRLHGLAPHANLLAPIALLGLLLELPRRNRGRVTWFWRAGFVVVLLLAQSKTTWVAAGVILLLESFRRSRTGSRRRRMLADGMVAVGAVLLGVFVWMGVALTDTEGLATQLHTVNARQDVWDITLKLWSHNPLFGYGLQLWGPAMRLSYLHDLGWAPPHAHNQLVQTLGEAGLVGAVALLFYVATLVAAGIKAAASSGGLSLAIVVLMLVRSLTECPLARAGGDLLLPVVAFVLLLGLLREDHRDADRTPDR